MQKLVVVGFFAVVCLIYGISQVSVYCFLEDGNLAYRDFMITTYIEFFFIADPMDD